MKSRTNIWLAVAALGLVVLMAGGIWAWRFAVPAKLVEASAICDLSNVRTLLAFGADANGKDRGGNAPLHLAALRGHKPVVELLLDHKADINVRDRTGSTPLHLAAFMGRDDVIALLVAHGANVNAKDNFGETPLHQTAVLGKETAARILVNNGARVDVPDQEGWTALHIAARECHTKIVELLLAHGANIKARVLRGGNKGETPLHGASAFRCTETAELLRQNGAQE